MIVECRDGRDYEAALARMAEGGAKGMILGSFVLRHLDKVMPLPQFISLQLFIPTESSLGQAV